MLLRASGEFAGELDLRALTDGDAIDSGVAHGDVLVRFADAVVRADEDALAPARAEVVDRLGSGGLVDAAAVAANFQRMVRIADGTGIPLDAPMLQAAGEVPARLGLDRFGSARSTPARGAIRRWLGKWLGPLRMAAMRRQARRIAGD